MPQLKHFALIFFLLLAGCQNGSNLPEQPNRYQPQSYIKLNHPDWSKNASIYQLNTRQFTEQGTFRAAEAHLPRLKALGVDILWLMPIHPIGQQHRKGSLGSPYSVKDYYAVNPEFGTLADLKHFVAAAHRLGMHVILDWVANHTAWDNPLRKEHPDWYEHDEQGNFRPTPWWDWSDIIDLDYSQPGLRQYMTQALTYWVKEADIDGYRCDVAGFVPVDFWDQARAELDAIKPVFMLAEWESRDLHARAFDMTYAWSWWDHLHKISQGVEDVNALFVYYSWNESAYPKDAYRMTFVSNHDKNAWEATQYEAFGNALDATIVLSVTGDGMPLIYNGQEAGNDKRLAFFDKDSIHWRQDPIGTLYQKLLALKKQNSALWNGHWGATMRRVHNNVPAKVLSFIRQNSKDKVFVVLNLSADTQKIRFTEPSYQGRYLDFFADKSVTLTQDSMLELAPWQYKVYVK